MAGAGADGARAAEPEVAREGRGAARRAAERGRAGGRPSAVGWPGPRPQRCRRGAAQRGGRSVPGEQAGVRAEVPRGAGGERVSR